MSASRKAQATGRSARSCSWAKAYLDVLSMATQRYSLPSTVRTSAISIWKKPIG